MPAPKGNKYGQGNPNSGRPPIWTDEKIEEEAKLLIEFAQKPTSLVLGEHYGARGYSYEHSMDWEKKNKAFYEAKRLAKCLIGARRERGAILGDYDSPMVRASMANYDPEYRAMLVEMKRDAIASELDMVRVLLQEKGAMDAGKDNKAS